MPTVPRSLRRVPAPLLALLVVCVVEAVAWIVVLPPLQGPDEISHVAYVQGIVEGRTIPWKPRGDDGAGGPPYSLELATAEVVSGASALYANPAARPAGSAVDERALDAEEKRFGHAERANGGFTSALKNPPAYYLYASLTYAATYPLGVLDQVFFMRLANIPFLLVTVLCVWLVAGELLGRRRWLQTLAAGAAALQPQLMNVTATVNPDIQLVAVWSAALYLMIVILRRGLTSRRAAALLALCLLSGFTHGRGIALVAPALLALGLAAWKARRPGARPSPRRVLALGGLGALASAAAITLIAVSGHMTTAAVRQFASYVWQFYLPRQDFLTQLGPIYGFREIAVERLFGGFAQLEIAFSPGVNDAIWTGLVAVAVSAAVALYLERAALWRAWDVVAVLVVTVIATLGLLHIVGFRSLAFGSGDPIIAGRYLLVFSALYGTAVALAVAWLPRRAGVAAGGALMAVLLLVQLGAFGLTLERFYA